MANTIPCGKCKFYDIILGSYEKETKRGWCMKRSKYPFTEGPGQVFPDEAERVEANQLAKPFIVLGKQVFDRCPYVEAAALNQAEQKREQRYKNDATGKRILS